MIDHARRTAPKEACGVLGGEERTDKTVISRADQGENVADDPTVEYEVDPAVALETIERIEAAGAEHLGFWHSHPAGPPEPSATDRKQATWPDYIYLIVDLSGAPSIRAWEWTGEAFLERPLSVENG